MLAVRGVPGLAGGSVFVGNVLHDIAESRVEFVKQPQSLDHARAPIGIGRTRRRSRSTARAGSAR